MSAPQKDVKPERIEVKPQQAQNLLNLIGATNFRGDQMAMVADLVNTLNGIIKQAGDAQIDEIEQAAIQKYLADQKAAEDEKNGVSEGARKRIDEAKAKTASNGAGK